jgi:hypothetical protein
MNVTESCDLNTLLRWLLRSTYLQRPLPTELEARTAAAHLAARSHKALMAGLSSDDVENLWPLRRSAPDKRRRDLARDAKLEADRGDPPFRPKPQGPRD